MEPETSLPHPQVPVTCPYPQNISPDQRLTLWLVRNFIRFYSEDLFAPRPTPKLEDHPLSGDRDCLLNIFAAALHIAGSSSICNLRTRHAVVTVTHLSWLQDSCHKEI
jgi:hypothetical protein